MHIALLDVDIPVPAVYPHRGLYSTQFRALLHRAATRLQISPREIHTSAYDVVGGVLPPLESLRTEKPSETHSQYPEHDNPLVRPIDGILITGAAAASYDLSHPWISPLQDFITTVYKEYPHVRFFGSCFGHQIIAQALLTDAQTDTDTDTDTANAATNTNAPLKVEACPSGAEIGLEPISLSAAFTAAFPGPCEKLRAPQEMRLQMIHGDWVVPSSSSSPDTSTVMLPHPWINMGYTPTCPIQGLYCPGRVLTYQGHFEFDAFVNRESCLEFGRRGGWSAAKVGKALAAIDRAREGVETEEEEEDVDDARVAAEVVVLFFMGREEAVLN